MRRDATIDACCLALTHIRNPDESHNDIMAHLGWTPGKYWHLWRALNVPNVSLDLWPMLVSLREGRLPKRSDAEGDVSFRLAHDLMMVGTPPWTPSDYCDVSLTGKVMVPSGRTITETLPIVYKEPTHGS